jgi:hypothetical protein
MLGFAAFDRPPMDGVDSDGADSEEAFIAQYDKDGKTR